MTISSVYDATPTLVVGTENIFYSGSVVGKLVLRVDLNALAAQDILLVRVYQMTASGGTTRIESMVQYSGAQSSQALVNVPFEPVWNDLTDSNAVRFSLQQTQGAGARSIPCKVVLEDNTVNVTAWQGTAQTPATAGIPDVNMKNANNVAATSITTINANLGTTQPLNFTGTAGSALVKGDTVDIAGTASQGAAGYVGTDQAQITNKTATADLSGTTIKNVDNAIASVTLVATTTNLTNAPPDSAGVTTLLSRISAAITITSGAVDANLKYILGTLLTETAGQIAAAFKQFFNIASPTSTMNTITTVTTTTNLTNAPTAGDFTTAMKTSLNAATPSVTVSDKTGFSLSAAGIQAIWDRLTSALTTVGSIGKLLVDNIDATISSRTKPADTQARVTLVDTLTTYTGNTPQTGDAFLRLGAPAGASIAADIAEVEGETDAIQAKTDQLAFTVANQVDSNVLDWKSATAPAMTGDAYARLGAPANATIAADIAEVEGETDGIAAIPTNPLLTNDARLPSGSTPVSTLTVNGVWDEVLTGHVIAASAAVDLKNAASGGSAPTVNQIWDEVLTGHNVAASAAVDLKNAGAAGDPWAIDVPASYPAGSAGYYQGQIPDILTEVERISDIGAVAYITSPVDGKGNIQTTQGATYTNAVGLPIDLTFTCYVDPTGGTPELSAYSKASGTSVAASPYTGTIVSYDSAAHTAKARWELTAAQTAAISSDPSAGYVVYQFEAKILLPNSLGALVPIAERNGQWTHNYSPTANV